LVILVIVLVGIIGFAGWYLWNKTNQPKVSNYQECIKAKNSKLREIYPEQCVVNGQTFTNPNQKVSTTVKPLQLEKGDFGDNGDYGTFQAQGYAVINKVDEAECETNCKQYDYVSFVIIKTENNNVAKFFEQMGGNSFVGDNQVGIGCLNGDKIEYFNASDANPDGQYTISAQDTSKIIKSTKTEPIVLEITKEKYTSGRGAPACTSLFTNFIVIN
jgi:hypothetical protein